MIEKIRTIIRANSSFLVVSHKEPDGDSIGSLVAFASILNSIPGKTAYPYYPVKIPQRFSFLTKEQHLLQQLPQENFDILVMLDCASADRIAGLSPESFNDKLKINIDHHPTNPNFADINWVEPERSSVGEMVFELFTDLPLPHIALEGLYTAILTDTGRFSYQNVNARVLQIASRILDSGVDHYKIVSNIYFNYPFQFLRELGRSLSNAQFFCDGKILFLVLDSSNDDILNECESVVEFALLEKGIEVGVLFRALDSNKTKISLRSRDRFDVGELASFFGGGGHRTASGCILNFNLKDAQKIVLDEILRRGI